ncbi:Glucitol operon repressor [Anaerohalosphaera lusitana]|uniref:Glucitol operon repressor n=1 Tax=Anaerohalosphaera lusitana TaxID=1936003 RepID=A0A1U9NH96_9BACT|nr:DeoR/GlpR family DNA-binding transcription regulator [Anaerohalosphaera lusitana]AQT67137.1 Glucitol operon repressor [Anaerohalosphaera lusitana]
MGLLAESRHQYILDKLRSLGRIQVASIASELGVTEVTIRRDLTQLQKQGLLKKTYGGAVLAGRPELNAPVNFRKTRNLSAKKTIGELASRLINDGDNIYLEAGTTCNEIIPHLTNHSSLTIIVNSLFLMRRLHDMTQHRIILTGGQYRPDRMDMIGPAAEATIAQLAGFKAFTGADDISLEAGISGADVVTVSFTKLVIKRASKVIFVGDNTKFDNPALYQIADINQLDYIVTNRDPGPNWRQTAREENVQLIYGE